MRSAAAALARVRPWHATLATGVAALLVLLVERAYLTEPASVTALLAWTALAVPAHALARPRSPVAAAAVTLVVALAPLSVHAFASTRTALAVLAGAVAVLGAVRAVAARAARDTALAVGLAAAAAALDAALLPLPAALALAVATRREHVAWLARWPGSAALALGLAALYPLGLLLASLSETFEASLADPWRLFAAALAAAASLAFAVGVVPWLLAWTAESDRALLAVLAWTAPPLAVAAALAGGGLLDDRALAPLVPLVAALAARTWGAPRPVPRLTLAAVATVVCAGALARLDAPSPTLAGAPGLALLGPAGAAGAATALGAAVVVVAFAALADRDERGAAWLAAATAALVVAAQLLAFADVHAG